MVYENDNKKMIDFYNNIVYEFDKNKFILLKYYKSDILKLQLKQIEKQHYYF